MSQAVVAHDRFPQGLRVAGLEVLRAWANDGSRRHDMGRTGIGEEALSLRTGQ